MLKNLRKSNNEGFTIIEVMIVLAIAGLIILIVFLAVPALQRNSRNTQRKNDVSALIGAVNEYTSNNGGSLPPNAGAVTALAKTAFYSGTGTGQGQINLIAGTPTQSALANSAANDRVVIVTGADCAAAGGATVPGPARGIAVQYLVEISGGYTPTCQAS